MGRYFKFKNIKIADYGSYVLVGATNLETGSSTKRKISYTDSDGSTYKDIYYNDRMFEISGFINATNEADMVSLKRKLIHSCSMKEEFMLEYFNRREKYVANCYFDKLPTFNKRQGWTLSFKLYLTIPSFYWLSYKEYNIPVFEYKDTITTTFKLPCVFTQRFDNQKIYNNGDCEVYPIFEVINESVEDGSNIVIKNNTTNKTITVNYEMSRGEIVTIDTFYKTVTSNQKGNITNKITLDTDFFELILGENDIESISLGNLVITKFRERFFGV